MAENWKPGGSKTSVETSAVAMKGKRKEQRVQKEPGSALALAWTHFMVACRRRFATWPLRAEIKALPGEEPGGLEVRLPMGPAEPKEEIAPERSSGGCPRRGQTEKEQAHKGQGTYLKLRCGSQLPLNVIGWPRIL
ncbi:hypothetical protein Y1Q_0012631 [Alligator mississippiensis]|uniref:Uncharacterized protein n=1 Tax=Alligator mississippiensis TaxID=8496 RepID=A0A151M8D3_ALLMI|nr:hypothetical protein Y1Q_0012631 [Alligator mississippiensis]